jgi:hypothetical protein
MIDGMVQRQSLAFLSQLPANYQDMIDALIKRVSVTYKCYEMYVYRGKKVQLLVF